jgi:ABC-2 type transport system permease protein
MFWKLTTFEFKLQLRNFLTSFFALCFPVMMLLLFGSMYGNEPSSITGDRGTVDLMLPTYTCMIVAVNGLMSLPLTVANYREQKILKRFMATPVQPLQILVSQVVANSITTLAGMVLLLVVAVLVYQVQFFGSIIPTVIAFLLVLTSMFSLGLVISGVTPNARAASSLAFVLYFPMLFLSGASIPLYIMPKAMVTISNALPLTYGVRLLSGVWLGGRLFDYGVELAVLLGTILLCTAVAIRYFRWE